MTVKTRLVVFGAVLPTAALLAAVLVAGWLFERDQLQDLDRRLLAQAAVESVGLFDGPDGHPHTHVPESPIADQVKDFAPAAAIYDRDGQPAMRLPAPHLVPDRVPFVGPLDRVRLTNATVGGIARRVLALPLRAPDAAVYTLWLGASLAPIARTMAWFQRATAIAIAALGGLLLAVQLAVARRLAARIAVMTEFLPRLRDGQADLPDDATRDELAALRDTLRTVARRLAEARAEQDRLLASAAHELRSPLAVIRTEIDLALRRDRAPDELRVALRAVRTEVLRLADLAGALLDLQAVRHVGFVRTDGDLAALVREAAAALAGVAETTGIEIRVRADERAPARFDERAMRQAVDNLLGNALKHAPPGTIVEASVERHADRWLVAVADRGAGIPPAEADLVFAPFHRLATTGTGAGLGLAIVREVIQRHGGRAFIDPAHTPGARVVLELADESPR